MRFKNDPIRAPRIVNGSIISTMSQSCKRGTIIQREEILVWVNNFFTYLFVCLFLDLQGRKGFAHRVKASMVAH